MAHGIRQAETRPHLMTYHPPAGRSSADELLDAGWLDFHMCQSGHSADRTAPRRLVGRMRDVDPTRPCVDGEPCDEDHPIDFSPAQGWFDADDVTVAISQGITAAAAGFAYGAHSVWQWFDTGREPVSHARRPWHEALDLPGSSRVAALANLIRQPP